MKSKMESASEVFSRAVGSSQALLAALGLVLVWAVTSDWPETKHDWNDFAYKLIVILAFLRVFFLERARYKEMQATQIKLNELIRSKSGASNTLIGAERAPQEMLENIMDDYEKIKHDAASDESVSLRSSSAKPDAARSREG
ncbi:MAG: low affinity iron permease family protein [Candidatus Obscuribacterales bacterium]|nr:low affinity iron permease family protein [Candidatus Obscuribacterales bacterium]